MSKRVAIVTGGSMGIGLSVAHSLLLDNYIVYALSRSHSNELEGLQRAFPSMLFPYSIDVNDHISFQLLARNIWSEHKTINAMVHSAGMAHGGLLPYIQNSDLMSVFQTNFFSPIMLTKLLSRFLSKSDDPSVVFISSSSAFRSDPGTLAYASSKAALNYATRQLAQELGRTGIRVNCVAPGVTDTSMLKLMNTELLQTHLQASALGSIATPNDIANTVLFLCSKSSLHITGQVIRVDGGQP